MKKVLFVPLTALVGALTIGYVSSHKSYQSLKADEMITHIEMNADAFTDYSEEKGSFANADATFWGENYSFNALEPFFRGESAEGWTGSLTLKSWKQYTQFIRFQWGGAHNIEDNIYLEIHYGEYSVSVFNETFSENTMMMDYFKIPDEQFALLDKTNGFDMYIKLVDNRSNDYGFHNFGCLYVNQNEEEVSNAMRYYLNHINLTDTREWKLNNSKTIYNYYLNNDHLKSVFLKTVSSADEDFEDINAFLNHWYIDVNYGNNAADARHVDAVLSNRAIRDGSNMQYNPTGGSYFAGWYDAPYGFIASDYPTYRFVSRPFVLGGTGLVSIKMAGRSASLHVIDADTQQDLAWADLRTFSTAGEESKQYLGFNTVTMVRHYINLSEYLGKKIQLAIADVYQDNWAASYFDELITKYETYPTFGIDGLLQDLGLGLDKTYSYYFDQYIASTHIDNDPNGLKYVKGKEDVTVVDETSIYQAYKLLKHYYSALRSEAVGFSYENATAEVRKELFDEYFTLDAEARLIFDNSKDFIVSLFDEEWHKRMADVNSKISASFSAIIEEFITYTMSFNANGGIGSMDAINGLKGEYTLPECAFNAPEGKEFAGWKVNNTGDLLEVGAKINVNDNAVLYAQWKDLPAVTFTISFNANGATGTMTALDNQHDEYVLPECAFVAPEGKCFIGWKINNTGDLLKPGVSINLNADITLYAQWEDIVYTISFNANGGTGTMANITKKVGETFTLPENGFTAPSAHKFIGWKVNNTGDLLEPGASITITADLSLVAQWEKIVIYTITFNPNGGTGSMSNMQVEKGQQLTLPACTFTVPENKEFDCWIIRNNLYKVGDKVDIIADTEVFAKWKNIKTVDEKYTVSFIANGGTGTMNDVTDVKGDYTLPACTFTAPEGQEFDCWLIGDEKYQPGDVININSDTQITACWKDKQGQNPGPGPDTSSASPDSSEPVEPSSEPIQPSSEQPQEQPSSSNGCGGSILATTTLLSVSSLIAIIGLAIKRRK